MDLKIIPNVSVFALAGGDGNRLQPLTNLRAKPAVPFGGKWTIFDLVMWSLYYSGLRDVGVLVQRNAVSMTDHLASAWPRRPDGGSYFKVLPPEGFRHPVEGMIREYLGTADAVYQHLQSVHRRDDVLIVAGDHLYKADFSHFWAFHKEHNADVTIMATSVPVEEAKGYGVMETETGGRVVDFVEKPSQPQEIPGNPGNAYCSMGVYLFKREVLEQYLTEDAEKKRKQKGDMELLTPEELRGMSDHDFGKDIIPTMIKDGRCVCAFPFSENVAPGQREAYWRDVGTLHAYWQAHMELCSDDPMLNLFTSQWPVGTIHDSAPPMKFGGGNTVTSNSHISGGCIITDSELRFSVLGRHCNVRRSRVTESILFDQLIVEPDCVIHKAIIDVDPRLEMDQRAMIPAGTQIGIDHQADKDRGFTVTEEGIVAVPSTWFSENGLIVDVS